MTVPASGPGPSARTGSVPRITLPAAALALALTLTPAPAPAADPPAVTAAQYAELIRAQRAEIKSFLVKYHYILTVDPAVKAAGLFRTDSFESTQSVTFAFSGGKQYCEYESEGVSRTGQPESTHRTTIFDGKQSRKRERKTLTIQEPKSAYAALNAYTSMLKWPVTDAEVEQAKDPTPNNVYLPGMLEHGTWATRPAPETVGGVSCVVLEQSGGPHTLWLDPRRGFALVRHLQKNPVPDCLSWDTTYADFVKVKTGAFLPRKVACVQTFADPKTKQAVGALRPELTVTELRVNDVPDSLFRLEPQPGETVADMTQGKVYVHAPATDRTLDENIEQVRPIVEHVEGVSSRRLLMAVAGGVAALVIGSLLLRRFGRPAG